VDCNEPRCDEVDQVMEHVGVRDSVDSSVDGDAEEKDTGEVAETRCDSRYHFATGQSLDQNDKRHDR